LPINSIIVVVGTREGSIDVPEVSREEPVTSTRSCILIKTLNSQDGDTSIVITDETSMTNEVSRDCDHVFHGTLETPDRIVLAQTAELETILEISVSGVRSNIDIWTNRTQEPDKIVCFVTSVELFAGGA
jgi:hypothetical protein